MGDFGSNRAAWLIAGFLGRKFMKDLLGRWSVLPVIAVGLCVWTKWNTWRCEGKQERGQLEELRRKTRKQLHILQKKSAAGFLPPSTANNTQQEQRRPGDRLGGAPNTNTVGCAGSSGSDQKQMQHVSPNASNGIGAAAVPKDALAAELWAWLGGVGVGRSSCGADRPMRGRGGGGGGGGGGGEWRGAFTNRMGNMPRRNAFKTARGKVYLRSGNRRPGYPRGSSEGPAVGLLEPVREEDEGGVAL